MRLYLLPGISIYLFFNLLLTTAQEECGSLDNPDNGVVKTTCPYYDCTASYHCNDGYSKSSDSETRTCMSDGTWSGNQAKCESDENKYWKIELSVPLGSLILIIGAGVAYKCCKQWRNSDCTDNVFYFTACRV